jgi:tetratricopeptide (TPR) repeat protein
MFLNKNQWVIKYLIGFGVTAMLILSVSACNKPGIYRTSPYIVSPTLFIKTINALTTISKPTQKNALTLSFTLTHTPNSTHTPLPVITLSPTALPTKTLSSTHTPTHTPDPTFVLETPLPDPKSYHLSELPVQKYLDLIFILKSQLETYKSEFKGPSDALNDLTRYIALVEQETLWHYSDVDRATNLNWEVASSYVRAGDQRATPLIAELIEKALRKIPSPDTIGEINHRAKGFQLNWIASKNLFGDDTDGWIIEVTKQPWEGGGGAVIAIRKSPEGIIKAIPLYSYWQPYFGEDFNVLMADHTADHIPEVIIQQYQEHGMGFQMRDTWLCIYQWHNNDWKNLTSDIKSNWPEVDSKLAVGCLVLNGNWNDMEYIATSEGQPDQLKINKLIDPYGCGDGEEIFTFTWDGEKYLRKVTIQVASSMDDLYIPRCIDAAWTWGNSLQNITEIIKLMENALATWPELQQENPDWFSTYRPPEFHDQFRFQLGRLYALAGNFEKAQEVLLDLVNNPSYKQNLEWPSRAQRYLDKLGNLQQAEQELANDLALLPDETPEPSSALLAGDIAQKASSELFTNLPIGPIVGELQAAIDNPDLMTIRESRCSDIHVDKQYLSIYLYQENECASVYYLLGLAYETNGEKDKARDIYWQLWKEYPDSFYAIAVQHKLEPVP